MIDIIVGFKEENGLEYRDRLKMEFTDKIHPLLRVVIFYIAYLVATRLRRVLVVTCLVRKPVENENDNGMPNSSHLTGRAADIRTRAMDIQTSDWIIQEVKALFGDKIHIIRHTAGTGDHLHVNVNYPYAGKYTEVIYARVGA